MSRHVKIGGIGINPIIDKINAVDKDFFRIAATKRMEQLIGIDSSKYAARCDDTELRKIIYNKIPIEFVWEEDNGMEDNKII